MVFHCSSFHIRTLGDGEREEGGTDERTFLLALLLHSLCFVSPLVKRGELLVLLPSFRVDAHLLLLVPDRALASLAAHGDGVAVCAERKKEKKRGKVWRRKKKFSTSTAIDPQQY